MADIAFFFVLVVRAVLFCGKVEAETGADVSEPVIHMITS